MLFKRYIAAVVILVLISIFQPKLIFAQLPIEVGNSWRYFKGTEEPPSNWKYNTFNDSSWFQGPSGFGYGDNDDNTILSDMQGNYSGLFIRNEFTINDPTEVEGLLFKMDYDDGFVAYLNGFEIARENVGGYPPPFDTTANGNHEASVGGGEIATYELEDSLLISGINVIGVQGYNTTINSSDFTLIPTLYEYYRIDTNIFGNGNVIISPTKQYYLEDDTVILSASPSLGWYFSHWSGDNTGNINPDTIVITDNLTIDVNFLEVTVPPLPPTNFEVISVTSYTIELGWVDVTNVEDWYVIERSSNENGPFTHYDSIPLNSSGYVDQNVDKGTTYCYRISAHNSIGISDTVGPICATTETVPSFTIIGLPDTQHYTDGVGSSDIFMAQTEWIVDNIGKYNIVFVSHQGDCVENGDNNGDDSEWQIVDSAISVIEDSITTEMLYGMPYGLAVGNHDQSPFGDANGTTIFYNQFFGVDRFIGRDYYGGHYGTNNDNHFQLFSAEGLDFIIINLEYDPTPNPEVLAWADSLLKTYSKRRAIINSHQIITPGIPGNFSYQGQVMYDSLKSNTNLFLMLCGHHSGEGQRTDVFNGNTVYSLVADYQSRTNGGNGWMRIMEFFPQTNEISVKTYSPYLDEWETDIDSEYMLYYDMQIYNCDITLYSTTCGDFEVKLRSNSNFEDTLSNIRFTLKWPANSVTLTNFYSDFGVTMDGSVVVEGDTNYAVFVSSAVNPINWEAGSEHTIFSFSHDNSSTGYASFDIDTDGWAAANDGDYYVEILDSDYTGKVIENSSNVYLGRCGEFKAFLQGSYNTLGVMNNGLKGNIPLTQPYNIDPWNYNGLESLIAMDTTTVDWVLVELRSDTITTVERKAVLLLQDGSIVQYNNTSQGVHFDNAVDGNSYYIVIYHRNHMPVMTAVPVILDGTLVDFSDEAICYGLPTAEIELENGIFGMIAGDINSNGILSYSGPGNDRGLILAKIVEEESTSNINAITNGYFDEDVLMNYIVKYIGGNNDRSVILTNLDTLVGSSLLNSIYQSVVPMVTTKSESINDGPIHIFLAETEKELLVKITSDEDIINGIVDNIQFTILWDVASHATVIPVIEQFSSDYGLIPQGEPILYKNNYFQTFVSAVLVALPAQFNKNEEVVLISFIKTKSLTLANSIAIANNNYTAKHNGDFYISLLGTNYTGSLKTSLQRINNLEKTGLSIYPNPIKSGVVNVKLNLERPQNVTITVVDIQEKILAVKKIQLNEGKSNNQIDLSNLKNGIYFIKIQGDNLNVIRKLIML